MTEPRDHPSLLYQLHQTTLLVSSVFVLGALLAQTLTRLPPRTLRLLEEIDFYVCLFFLYDFALRFYRAESKWRFMRWGWIDLVSSIPVLPMLRWGRIVRVLRILRLVRAFRPARQFVAYLFRDRAEGTLAVVLVSSVLLLVFGAIAVLNFETAPDSNIKTPADAFWWAFVTITTVGYGDKYPVTTEGRMVAAVLMIAGVGLFGTFTGYVANFFVEEDQQKEDDDIRMLIAEVRQLREKIEALERQRTNPTNPDREPRGNSTDVFE